MAYTFYNPKYERARVMRTVQVGSETFQLDLFDPKLVELMRNIRQWKPEVYDNSIPLTTISYRFYTTTTLDWVILMYNGFIHEFEIPDGTILKIPSLANVGQVFAEARSPSRVGEITTI